jgi:hypothetical protein
MENLKLPKSVSKFCRTNYRVTGAHIAVARGAKTASDPIVTDTTSSSIIYVSTGLASPAYGFAWPNASQTGMAANRELRWIGSTGSYAKFRALIFTGTGTYALIATGAPSTTLTFCFSWLAFED